MPTEIERRFLVDPTVVQDRAERSERVEQGYVAIDPEGAQVRVRKLGDDTFLTVKRGSGESRFEAELEIPESTFDSLWPLTESRRVEKRRYFGSLGGGLCFEADVFGGALAGLNIVEVEFDSRERGDDFRPPDWFGAEVTEDGRFSNASLAVDGKPETG